jgi:hypothetical protein
MLYEVKCGLSDLIARLGGMFCDGKQIVGFNLYTRDVKRDMATFNKTALDEIIQQDKFIGCVKFFTAENAYEDPTFATSAMGDRYKQTPGSVRWKFTFMKGVRFHNEMSELDGSSSYSIAFVDIDGKEYAKKNLDGTISGFKINIFTDNLRIRTAAEGQGSNMWVDILAEEIEAWNKQSVVIGSSEFKFTDIEPIEEVELKVPVLTAGATTTVIEITRAGSDAQMVGLTDKDNWEIVSDEVEGPITALTSVAGKYTFTHAALVTNKTVYFKTNMDGYPIYVLDTGYYVGKSTPKKVV